MAHLALQPQPPQRATQRAVLAAHFALQGHLPSFLLTQPHIPETWTPPREIAAVVGPLKTGLDWFGSLIAKFLS